MGGVFDEERLTFCIVGSSGAAAGAGVMARAAGRSADEAQAMSDKHLALFLMMNEWVKLKQEGRSLAAFLRRKGIKRLRFMV